MCPWPGLRRQSLPPLGHPLSLPCLCSLSLSLLKSPGCGNEESGQQKSKEDVTSDFFLSKFSPHPLAAVSTLADPKPWSEHSSPFQFPHTVLQRSLTLTVSSGREVAAASFPRAAESGYCPRWNSVETEVPTVRVRKAWSLVNPHSLPLKTLNSPPFQGQATHNLDPSALAHKSQAFLSYQGPSAPLSTAAQHLFPGPQLGLGRR